MLYDGSKFSVAQGARDPSMLAAHEHYTGWRPIKLDMLL